MTCSTLSPMLSVNDLLRHCPASGAVLNQLGIDTCCGGSLSLAEAAASINLPLARLLDALRQRACAS